MISKAWDNRYGVLMIRELLENVKDQELNNTLIAGANVQEEVGLRGAHVSTTKFDPEVFFAVDCSPAGDIYGNQGKVGDGTLIRFFDPGHIMLPNMKDFLLTTAEEAGIKYQYYCAAGDRCWCRSLAKFWSTINNYWCLCPLHSLAPNPICYG